MKKTRRTQEFGGIQKETGSRGLFEVSGGVGLENKEEFPRRNGRNYANQMKKETWSLGTFRYLTSHYWPSNVGDYQTYVLTSKGAQREISPQN